MIEADVGDHGHVRIDDVHRIETPAETHFEHGGIHFRVCNGMKRGEDRVLEVGELHVATAGLHGLEGGDDGGIAGFAALQANALVEDVDVRRHGGADGTPAGEQQMFQCGDRGALAVGAGHHHGRCRWRQDAEAAGDVAHPGQAAPHPARMFDADAVEPIGKGFRGYAVRHRASSAERISATCACNRSGIAAGGVFAIVFTKALPTTTPAA